MHEREKMQARFSKNNNFGGTLRTERNTFTLALFSQLFHHNATNSSLKYIFFHSQRSLLMSVSCNIQKPPSISFLPCCIDPKQFLILS